jgi:hypothetical protein
VWLIAIPYAHFIDEMLLIVPVIALLGRDGRWISRPVSVGVLYLLGLSILLYSWTPMHMQLLSLPLAVCAGLFGFISYRSSRGETAWLEPGPVETRAGPTFSGRVVAAEYAFNADSLIPPRAKLHTLAIPTIR